MTPAGATPWPPLATALLAVAALHAALLLAWGDPPPLRDELGYVETGRLVAEQIRGGGGDPAVLGRVAWHNAGYSALFVASELLLPGSSLPIRILQVLAGLASGFLVWKALERRVERHLALGACLVVWLDPSAVFFRLSLWPAAIAVLLTSALALAAVRLADVPEDPGRQWAMGLALLPLPFFAAQALALLPGLLVWPGLRRAPRVMGPLVAIWLPWMAAISISLGTFSPIDLAGPGNLALGNHHAIAEGRGSLWGDPERRAVLDAELVAACPQGGAIDRFRCQAAWSVEIARTTVLADPPLALRRAGLRVLETWAPDRFLARHLVDRGVPVPSWLQPLLAVLHFGLLAAALLGLMSAEGRLALLGVVLWCGSVLPSVGFTRLRQPLLPWLVLAAATGLAALARGVRARRKGR